MGFHMALRLNTAVCAWIDAPSRITSETIRLPHLPQFFVSEIGIVVQWTILIKIPGDALQLALDGRQGILISGPEGVPRLPRAGC